MRSLKVDYKKCLAFLKRVLLYLRMLYISFNKRKWQCLSTALAPLQINYFYLIWVQCTQAVKPMDIVVSTILDAHVKSPPATFLLVKQLYFSTQFYHKCKVRKYSRVSSHQLVFMLVYSSSWKFLCLLCAILAQGLGLLWNHLLLNFFALLTKEMILNLSVEICPLFMFLWLM